MLVLYADRRLCPGLAFFQNATPHTLDVLNNAAGTFETLRVRVERSVLKSQSVSRNRLGFTAANVTNSPCIYLYRVPVTKCSRPLLSLALLFGSTCCIRIVIVSNAVYHCTAHISYRSSYRALFQQ